MSSSHSSRFGYVMLLALLVLWPCRLPQMKAALGVGISVLSALAAQGKDFDRTELNAMLDRIGHCA